MCLRLIPGLLMAFAMAGSSAGDSHEMVYVDDLRNEARIVRENRLVLMLEFSSEYCEYCRLLESLFLLPMQRNTDYNDKVLIRSVSLDDYETLIDFEGQSVSTADFASQFDVSMTPTLLFLNAEGVEISERLVGIWSEDYYGEFIDDRIDEARDRL